MRDWVSVTQVAFPPFLPPSLQERKLAFRTPKPKQRKLLPPLTTHLLSRCSREAALLLGSQVKSHPQRKSCVFTHHLSLLPRWRWPLPTYLEESRTVLIPHFEIFKKFFPWRFVITKLQNVSSWKLKMLLSPLYWWLLLVFGPLENVCCLILLKESRPERDAHCVMFHQNLSMTPSFLHNKALL